MALPWLQIVQWVPSILDVSRELLRKSRRMPEANDGAPLNLELATRIATLEENERRQAELINQMAEQISVQARALTALHKRIIWLTVGCGLAVTIAVIALFV